VLLAQAKLPDGHGELYVLLALAAVVVLVVLFFLVRRAHLTAVDAEARRQAEAGEQPPS